MNRNDPSGSLEVLLAAHADGALDGPEAADVEALVERDAEAARELDSMRETIDEARAARPEPSAEPNWDQMAAEIRAACARDEAPVRWWRRLWRPAPAFAMGVAVTAAVAAMIVVSGRGGDRDAATAQPEDPAAMAARMDLDELEEMDAYLEEIAIEEGDEPVEDDANDQVAMHYDNAPDGEPDDLPDIGLYGDAELSWLEEVRGADLDALADYLDEIEAG